MVPTDILKHDTMCTGAKHNNLQHSGLSHRVEAYIKDNRGYVKKHPPRRSMEKPLTCIIKRSHPYFGIEKDRYRWVDITIKAAANYPYNDFAPDIDFEMTFRIERKNINGHIKCEGKHNSFPAYELIINDKRIYHYKPKDSGPRLLNLTLYYTIPNLNVLNMYHYENCNKIYFYGHCNGDISSYNNLSNFIR